MSTGFPVGIAIAIFHFSIPRDNLTLVTGLLVLAGLALLSIFIGVVSSRRDQPQGLFCGMIANKCLIITKLLVLVFVLAAFFLLW